MTGPGFGGRTVLVTGGAGFGGGHLVDALVPDVDLGIDHGPARSGDVPEGEADRSRAHSGHGFESRITLADGLRPLLD